MIVMRGLTFHPAALIAWISGLYFAVFSFCAVFGNLSWQYVNSMHYITFGWVGIRGVWLSGGAPSTHSMSGLSLAKHVHSVVWHEHWSSQFGTVLSCGMRFWFPAFIRV